MANIPIIDNYGKVVGFIPQKLPSAEKSAILTYRKNGFIWNIILPILKIGIYRKPFQQRLILHTEDLKKEYINKLRKVFPDNFLHSVMFTITNDPMIKHAGSPVSLGYYCFRYYIENARIISYVPLVFETPEIKDLILKPHLPIR